MAAAVIPLVAAGVQVIAPLIPNIVQTVENLFGHSSQTGKQDGSSKLTTTVSLLQQLLTEFANAGKMPSAPVVDPGMPAALAGATQQAVTAMKAQGLLGPPASDPKAVPTATVQMPAQTTFTGTFTITAK